MNDGCWCVAWAGYLAHYFVGGRTLCGKALTPTVRSFDSPPTRYRVCEKCKRLWAIQDITDNPR